MDRLISTSISQRTRCREILGILMKSVALVLLCLTTKLSLAQSPFVAIIDMNMMILPGTQAYLTESIERAEKEGAKALIVKLDTPGGMLETSQEMIQKIFESPVPIIIYVSPNGATATSAGVFITLAGHVAAMAPGTSIGAAHPVMGDGKDIEGDMRTKAENMTIAMVKSIAERRGRNVTWAEKAVKESASITAKEALQLGVVDIMAEDIDDLLKRIKGKEFKIDNKTVQMADLSALPRQEFEISFKQRFTNVLANPNVAALLWLGATTGISLELYNPGAILPGTIGLICLILALAVSQIIPINQAAIALMAFGAILIGAELYKGTVILGLLGLICIVLGAVYLVDVGQAPGLSVALEFIVPVAIMFAAFLFWVAYNSFRVARKQVTTGLEGLIGEIGEATSNIATSGKVFVNGEYWNACVPTGLIEKGAKVKVVSVKDGLTLEVAKSA
ncbi:MAG: serine protease [Proteobacteria bacterium]|nr:MAG: serine protease [Pseudomonadota bacterium]